MPETARRPAIAAQRRDDPSGDPPHHHTPRAAAEHTQPGQWSRPRVTGLLLAVAVIALALAVLVIALVWRPLTTPLRSHDSSQSIHIVWMSIRQSGRGT